MALHRVGLRVSLCAFPLLHTPDLLLSFVGFAHAGKKNCFSLHSSLSRTASNALRIEFLRDCASLFPVAGPLASEHARCLQGLFTAWRNKRCEGVRVCRLHVAETRETRLPALEVSSNLRHALSLAPALVTALQPNLGWCATGRYGCDTTSQRLRNDGFLILRLATAGFSFLGPVCNGLDFDTTKKHQKTIWSGWGSGTNSLVVCRDTRCALG